jgi:hypothetical protein
MTSFDSVCASDTGIPSSSPKVTNRCSWYLKRLSSNVNVGPAKILCASTKSTPWSLRFCSRFASSHSNRIYGVYIHANAGATGRRCRITPQFSGGALRVGARRERTMK